MCLYGNPLQLLLRANRHIVVPGIFDPLSAKLAEINGFEAAWVSGFCVSTTSFLPDENVMTIDHFTSRIREIRNSTDIPLIVDCDEGYGDIDNTLKLLSILRSMNIEGCCIEDNKFPKTNSFKEADQVSKRLETKQDFSRKLSCIKEKFPELVLIARTESLIVGEELSSAICRAREYKAAGADLVVIHSKSVTHKDFENIIQNWEDADSLVVIPTLARDLCFQDFCNMGYKVVIYANQLLRNNISVMGGIFKKIQQNCAMNELINEAVTMDYIFNLIDTNYKGNKHA